jgi:multidrug efflux pump subunit AcrA (membrane-fusion protein)
VGDSLKAALLAVVALLLASGCHSKEDPAKASASAEKTPAPTTPVKVAKVERTNLSELITAPGKTAVLSSQKMRAPFAGTLTELRVADGDIVRRGQVLGVMVARESEAAVSGAREMIRQASTPAEKADGERALALAEKNLVRRPLVASWSGAISGRAASAGDRLAEDQEILTIQDTASLVFLADVSQADLSRVHAGQRASIEIAGRPQPIPASVHGILPTANPAEFTGSVRLDLAGATSNMGLGLFGTARIVVGERAGVTTVPDGAILRDDVTGISRVALVEQNRAHWISVRTGLHEGARTEITQPALSEGQPVIVSGLVGLPESQPVLVRP